MFELTVALKYLVPRRKSLSTALISLMSVFVISLVVWLVLVFLSVTSGIEKNWLQKLTTLHAPLRISPTPEYYNSYYYQVDAISQKSDYTYKTIGEKLLAESSDPHSLDSDPEIPSSWPSKDYVDPVKKAFEILSKKNAISFQDYEIAGALLRVQRNGGGVLSQMSYLLSLPSNNPNFNKLIIEQKDIAKDEIPIYLPKSFKESGVKLGDIGSISYSVPSAGSSQEQKITTRVKGFYDPGILSIGNKCVIVPIEITRTIHAVVQTFAPDGTATNGIFVWFDNILKADEIKADLLGEFEKNNISKYWKIDTYKDFEFSKDLMNQFQSDKTLFTLLAAIILFVACSNIISLLVLLVNDKKKEIAVLQSMGASFKSIALIFGTLGTIMGAMGCIFGSILAWITLSNIDSIVQFLSMIQGRAAFNPVFFGQTLPNTLSIEALYFVLIATPILSLAAGLIPAIKACAIRPSNTLRTE